MTPDEPTGLEAFDTAILEMIRERTQGRDPGILTEYVIIASCRNFDDEGDGTSWIGYIPGPAEVPHHHLLGLLDAARIMITNEIMEDNA